MPDRLVGNIHISPRPDTLDAEQVSEAVRGRFWELMSERVRDMIRAQTKICLESKDPTDIARAQGAAAQLVRVLELPDILRREAQEKRKR
jgi:hypothetical protein